jgi:hypothetical protein
MPPKKKTAAGAPTTLTVSCFSRGSGMTAGLEVWRAEVSGATQPKFLLYDRSPDGRFASDVSTWNGAAALTPAVLTRFAAAAAASS